MRELPPELKKSRLSREKQIRMLRIFFYASTAAAFAAGASDIADSAISSALGNFGILLILARLYVLSPLMVSRSSAGDEKWAQAEADWAEDNYPWLDTLSRVGWGLLAAGVLMQLIYGVP